jgi:hypothetical protein
VSQTPSYGIYFWSHAFSTQNLFAPRIAHSVSIHVDANLLRRDHLLRECDGGVIWVVTLGVSVWMESTFGFAYCHPHAHAHFPINAAQILKGTTKNELQKLQNKLKRFDLRKCQFVAQGEESR